MEILAQFLDHWKLPVVIATLGGLVLFVSFHQIVHVIAMVKLIIMVNSYVILVLQESIVNIRLNTYVPQS